MRLIWIMSSRVRDFPKEIGWGFMGKEGGEEGDFILRSFDSIIFVRFFPFFPTHPKYRSPHGALHLYNTDSVFYYFSKSTR